MRLITSLVLLAVLAASASAQDGPRASALAREGLQGLQRYAEQLAKAGERPDYSKRPGSEHYARLFDLRTLMALPPSQGRDVRWLAEWLQAATQGFQAIVFLGTKPGPEMNAEIVGRNLAENESEVASGTDFLIRLQARVATSSQLFYDALTPAQRVEPIRQSGLQRVRRGYVNSVSGAVDMLGGGLKPANARVIATALRETAGVWVPFTTEADRSELLSGLAQARADSKDPEADAGMEAVSAAIANYKG